MWSIEFISELAIEQAAEINALYNYASCNLTHVHPTYQLLVAANIHPHFAYYMLNNSS